MLVVCKKPRPDVREAKPIEAKRIIRPSIAESEHQKTHAKGQVAGQLILQGRTNERVGKVIQRKEDLGALKKTVATVVKGPGSAEGGSAHNRTAKKKELNRGGGKGACLVSESGKESNSEEGSYDNKQRRPREGGSLPRKGGQEGFERKNAGSE